MQKMPMAAEPPLTVHDAGAEQKQSVLTALAPAKINLSLHVTGQRADGYHLLESLTVFADETAADTIEVAPSQADRFRIEGDQGGALDANAPDNLVLKARDWLRALAGRNGFSAASVDITLKKQLPVASGIGGGSADAAATLRALAACWQLPDSLLDGQNADLSTALGADVPMCVSGRALIARGIGERIDPVSALPQLPAVLVNPGHLVSTPDVFRALHEKNNAPVPDWPLSGFASAGALAAWLQAQTRNDLQAPATAIAPVVATVLEQLAASGARLARMSGSGATCFGLFDEMGGAEKAAEALATEQPSWWVQTTLLNADRSGT